MEPNWGYPLVPSMSSNRSDHPLDLPLVRVALRKQRWRRVRLAAFSFALGCLLTWAAKDEIAAFLDDARGQVPSHGQPKPASAPKTLSVEDVNAMFQQGNGQTEPASDIGRFAGPPEPQFKPTARPAATSLAFAHETHDEPSRCVETPRPSNGAILTKDVRGDHELVIHNGTDQDAVIKVRNSTRIGQVAFYVRARSTAQVGLPDGEYSVLFATGQKLSQICDRFLNGFTTWRFPGPQEFRTRIQGQYVVFSVLEFTLHTVPEGNIERRSIPHSEWYG